MTLRIVLAGGGTAGHVNPLLVTAQELRVRGSDVTVIGTEEGLESKLVPAAGFRLETIPKVPIPRNVSPALFSVPSRLRGAVNRTQEILQGADVLVGFGGYVSAPAYIAAERLRIPFVVQEQNVRAGWANKLGARNAAAVALTFSSTKLKARRGKTVVTGLPLRREIMEVARQRETPAGEARMRESAAKRFELDPERPTLLVTGGSLGAQRLNEAVMAAAPHLRGPVQILHATGSGKKAEVHDAMISNNLKNESSGLCWRVTEYINEMDQAMAAADLVLCRSGAGTVAEVCALGLPAFYVPLPVGNGEQRLNAEAQVRSGGAVVVEDKDFTAQTIEERVIPLLLNRPKLEKMGAASRSVSPGDGAQLLADLIESVI